MKAGFALLANESIENFACNMMLNAHKLGNLGLYSARIPHHISLKQPFFINNILEIESYFDDFVKTLEPFTINFTNLELWNTRIFGTKTGAIVLKSEKTKELIDIHTRLNLELETRFGSCPAEFDGDKYSFHMTISMTNKPTEECIDAFNLLSPKEINKETIFNTLGLIYADGDEITPDNYFCYKRLSF